MFDFLIGDLSDVRKRQTSAYTVGNQVLISEVSNVKQNRSVIVEAPDVKLTAKVDSLGLCYMPGTTDRGGKWIPFSYGNPVVNLGANLLLRAAETAGVDPVRRDQELY